MNYRINVSCNGRFYFEINRLSDEADENINEFVGKLRDDYKAANGYLVTVSQVRSSSVVVEI